MKIIFESPKGRVSIDGDIQRAIDQFRNWLLKHAEPSACVGVTVSVHPDGEDCDHETG